MDNRDVPFASQEDCHFADRPLNAAELRLASEIFELLSSHGPLALDFASRWILDLQSDRRAAGDALHAAMDAVHVIQARLNRALFDLTQVNPERWTNGT